MNKTNTAEYLEVDLSSIIKKLWAKKFNILIASVVVAVVAFVVTSQFVAPQYVATTRIYVVNKMENKQLTAQDLQIGNYLVKDYKEIILSRDVLREVIERQSLNIKTVELSRRIMVLVPYDTRVISISVRDKDPLKAKEIANSLRLVAAEKIKKVTKIDDVTVLEEAEVPRYPSSPDVPKIVLGSFLATMFLLVLVISVVAVINDKVIYPEDIEDRLGLPFLGFVPLQKKR